jgi:cytochrome b561
MDDATTPRGTAAIDAYDGVAIVLHWLLAALIVASFFIGLSMVDLPLTPRRLRFFNWHKWLGIAALLLSAARLLWRASGHPPPPLPAGTPAWQQSAYRGTHLVFYALFFAVPLLGWAYSSAVGFPVVWLGCAASRHRAGRQGVGRERAEAAPRRGVVSARSDRRRPRRGCAQAPVRRA